MMWTEEELDDKLIMMRDQLAMFEKAKLEQAQQEQEEKLRATEAMDDLEN